MSDTKQQGTAGLELTELTAEIVAAYVTHNNVPASDLPRLLQNIYTTLGQLGRFTTQEPAVEELKPAVPIRKSVTDDYLISLEDGQKFKSLKRHLMTSYGMTPRQYREKWGLPNDYPMVAPGYAKARSALAKSLGLGRKAMPTPIIGSTPAPTAKRPGRPKRVDTPSE